MAVLTHVRHTPQPLPLSLAAFLTMIVRVRSPEHRHWPHLRGRRRLLGRPRPRVHHRLGLSRSSRLRCPRQGKPLLLNAPPLTSRYSHSQDIINKYYASTDGIQYSYWSGCSTGGRQGLKEIQTHPDSFDGLAIGAPTWWITHISAGQLRRGLLNLPESDVKHIAPELFPVITKEMESQCDPQDGLSDGIISDPLGCDFDFEALLCKGSNSSDCLVEEQLDTLKKVYTDWHEDDTLVWSGSTLGTPPSVLQNASWAIGLDFFRYFVQNDSSWELTEFTYADLQLADDINPGDAIAGDFDLSAFKERGGKVLLYHGEADDAIPPGDSIYFREQVQETLGDNIDDFYRVFLIPGMGHCASSTLAPWYVGGAGHAFALGSTQPVPELKDPEHDVMLAVTQWVEENKAPEKLIATKFANDTLEGGVMGQRPVCVYPRKARYLEGEDPDEARSWECE